MERWDDPLSEMRDSWQLRHRRSFEPPAIDDDTARRVLDGLDPADVPPAYSDAARSLAMMRGPGQPDELASETAVVAAFAARVAQPLEPAQASRRLSNVSRIARPKLATAAVAGGLALTGGLAAAATGSLPGPAQSIVAETLSGIGIHVPHANSHAHAQPLPAVRGSVTGPNSLPLLSQSGASGFTTPGVTTPVGGSNSTLCSTASAGHCQAAPSGAGSNAGPAVSVPNPGGTGTANTASNGASLSGTTKANSASGGASGAGSGNATTHGGSNPPTPPSGTGAGNATSHGGSTTATGGSSGASGAGPTNTTAHPGLSPTNTTHGGVTSGGPATAARGAP